jgi:hypothetical protein
MENNFLLWNLLFIKEYCETIFHYGVRVNKITKFGNNYYPMTKINLLNISDDRIYTYFKNIIISF